MKNSTHIVSQQSLVKASITSVTEQGFYNLILLLSHLRKQHLVHVFKKIAIVFVLFFTTLHCAKADDDKIIKGGKLLVDSGPLAKVKLQTVNMVGEDLCDFWLLWTGAVKAKSVTVNGVAVALTAKANGKQHVVFNPCVNNTKQITIQAEFEGNISLLYLIPTDSMHSDLVVNDAVNPNATTVNKKIEKTTVPGGSQSPTFASSKFPSLGYTNLTGTDICDLRIESPQKIDSVFVNNKKVDSIKVGSTKVPNGTSANSKVVHVYFKCIKDGDSFKVSVAAQSEITTYKITPTDSLNADVMANRSLPNNGAVEQGKRARKTNTTGGQQSPTFEPSSFPRLSNSNATGTDVCDMRIKAPTGVTIDEVWVNDKKVDSIYGTDGKKITARPTLKNEVHVFFPCIADGAPYTISVKFNKACTTYVYTPTDSLNADISCGIQNINPGNKATRQIKFSGSTPGSTFSSSKSSTVFKNDTKDTICDLEIIAKESIDSILVNGVKWDTKPAGQKNDTIHVYAPNGGGILPGGKMVVTVYSSKKIDGYSIEITDDSDETIYQLACTGGTMKFYLNNDNSAFGLTSRSGSLVAINESCSPISQLVFNSPHPGIIVDGASSKLPSYFDFPTGTLNFYSPILPGAPVQFSFHINTLLPYSATDTFPYTTVNVSVPGTTISYDGTATITPASSLTEFNGSIDFTLTGDMLLPSFLWSNGSTTEDISNLASGTYTVTVSDANGCMTKVFEVPVSPSVVIPNPELTLVSAGPWCSGSLNGFAMVMDNVKDNMLPLNYVWSNGATTAIINNLSAGNLTVNVTNASGFSWTGTVNLTEPSLLSVTANVKKLNCNNDFSGSITLIPSGGTFPYLYKWNNGNTNQARTGLKAGTYTATVSDANGCSLINSYQVKQPLPLQIVPTLTSVTCFGGNNGSASIVGTGGTKPYTFLWTNGMTTAAVTNLTAGTYNVILTDAKGCLANSTINISSPPPIQINVQPMPPSQAIANVFGGLPPYQIFWNTMPPQTGPLATGLYPGQIVQLQVMDNSGCMQMQTFIMPQMKLGNTDFSSTEIGLTLYPNPAKNFVTLHIDGFANESADINLFDALGNKVLSQKNLLNNGTDIVLNVMHLSNGIYTLELQLQGQTHRMKLSVHN